MKEKLKIAIINSQGHANGWVAQMLEKRAVREGKSMSELFKEQIADSIAFSVPAKVVKLNSAWINYEFLDGSKLVLANNTN